MTNLWMWDVFPIESECEHDEQSSLQPRVHPKDSGEGCWLLTFLEIGKNECFSPEEKGFGQHNTVSTPQKQQKTTFFKSKASNQEAYHTECLMSKEYVILSLPLKKKLSGLWKVTFPPCFQL